MSIVNELSSDVAIAVLALRESTISKKDLTEIVLKFHTTLRDLTIEARRREDYRSQPSSSQSVAFSD